MPGGSGIVALRSGDAEMEREAARFVAWLGAKEQAREWYTKVFAILAHAGLQEEGLDYEAAGASRTVSEGLATYTAAAARAAKQTPQAFRLQGDPRAYLMFNATTEYLAAAMNDQMSLDEALQMIGNVVRMQTSN